MATTTQKLGKVGLVDKGVYDETTEYARLDFVTDENNISTYISLVDGNTGHPLTDSVYWRYLAKGKANTPEEVLDLLLQVDGSGSGLDADKLDGTELEEIVNPEALASASPFDFFLGAKQVEVSNEDGTTENKWVFKKMAPAEVATVVAGLMGLSGVSIRKMENTNSGATPVKLFDNCSRGIVFLFHESSTAGRNDSIIYIANSAVAREVKLNTGDSGYQNFYMNNGALYIANNGYGVGSFYALLIEEY